MGDQQPNVLIDQPAEGVTRLTLNRPDRLNALTRELVDEVHAALDAVDADHDCRVVVITGAGKGFCAGLDLNGFGEIPGTEHLGGPQRMLAVQQHISEVVHHIRAVRQPVIAAINGAAAGGGYAWACACDIRYCSHEREVRHRVRAAGHLRVRHGHQLDAAPADRRVARVGADPHRPGDRQRRGRAARHRQPGGARRRADGRSSRRRRRDRRQQPVRRVDDQGGALGQPRDPEPPCRHRPREPHPDHDRLHRGLEAGDALVPRRRNRSATRTAEARRRDARHHGEPPQKLLSSFRGRATRGST